MARRRPWKVTSHGPIHAIDQDLWAVEGPIPGLGSLRRMFIVRRKDGGLVFSGAAIPLHEAALAELRRLGTPAMLVVPHQWHMIDAQPFAEKLQIPIFGPAACAAKLRRRADIAGSLQDIAPDPRVTIESLAGTRKGEPVLIVNHADSSGSRHSLLFADAIQNSPASAMGLPMRLLGFAGGLKAPPVFKRLFVADRPAFAQHLARLAALPGLSSIVPCHGDILTRGAAPALQAAAAAV